MTTLDPYWRETLAEAESTRLPRYPASGLSDTDQVATHPVALPAALTRQLRDRAANTGVPLPSLFLTAHVAVLGFLADSEDILTGYRDGALTGPLPLRVRLDGGTWDDLLAQVDAVRQEVLAHADSGPERSAELAGGDGGWFETALVVTEGDLDCPFQVELSSESGPGEFFQIRYRERDFAADQIERIGGYYQRALEHLGDRASENYRPYDLLAASEDALLRAWCGPDRPLGELTYPALFERMAARRPDAIALECGERRLTYAELDVAAQRVARYCASQGVRRGDIVTTLLPRDLPWAVSALALLRMGAGYLPQHPDHPAERVAAALVRSGCRHVITDPELTGDLLAQLRERIPELLVLDVTAADAPPRPATEIDSVGVPRALPGDPAYVIFTSGSTGEPKGAVIPHTGLLNHMITVAEELGLTASDRVAQIATQCFDISVVQLFAAWACGGVTKIYPRFEVMDVPRLVSSLASDRVTVLEVVPSYLDLLLAEVSSRPVPLPDLRFLLSVGEPLPPALANRWFERYPKIQIVNAYGPTECTDNVTHHRIDAPVTDARVPVGHPAPNTGVYVLGSDGGPRPIGCYGEICVTGAGVALGYVNDPERTAMAFLPNRFDDRSPTRYRTGDIGRWLPGGVLDCAGRRDDQVKVRGFRIELSEIDAALVRLPGVDAAVTLACDRGGQNQLVAYYLGPAPAELADFQRGLAAILPTYMYPERVVRLERFPLTVRGKIDKRALATMRPAPERSDPAPAAAPVPQRTDSAPTEVPDGLLPDLIGRQAELSRDAIAVVADDGELTYLELDRRANQLANLLLDLGAEQGDVAAVCLHRGTDLAVALLGSWRAGLAYLPLHPDHPRDRLAWQLADTGAKLLLTTRALRDGVPHDGTTICLDDAGEALAGAPGTPPPAGSVTGDDAAYVVYTSGSTGRPKGVIITHAGIANRVLWTVRRHRLSAADRVLQKTALSFDAACWEVFAPLVAGGTVVMAPVGAERDPAQLVHALSDRAITVLQVVPSVLRMMVDVPDWRGCQALRLVFSAGEPLRAELCQRLLTRVTVEIWNTYGPTECSIDATAHQFDPTQTTGPVSIGRPIANTRVRVLDSAGHPVPVGVQGELFVGGVGLARGYVGRPDLTAERFVPDRFSERGSRLYRTGDLVRWHSDGTLEYLGRIDDQLKINGVRTEPGEVEAAILRHPDVHGVAVTGFTDATGATRLAAFLLKREIERPETLRDFLAQHLPAPLIPSVFIALDEFPTTTSGKIDRRALPVAELSGGAHQAPYRPPTTTTQVAVAAVWQRLLNVERVGLDDDFFQRGGSSLMITKLASDLAAATGVELAVADLYDALTVAAQAQLVAAGRLRTTPMERLRRDGPLPLSFGQQRQWFLDRLQPGSVEWLAPVLLTLPSDLSATTVQRALDVLQARHESLRTRYLAGPDGVPAQVIDEPTGIALRVVTPCEGEDLGKLFARELERGFDLEHGPLVRALLVRAAGPEQQLLLTMHHIACDGWSTVVLDRELRQLCGAFEAGRQSSLPPLPIGYVDFAAWQRRELTDEVLDRELSYWRGALDGLVPLELPIDRPRPAEWDPTGALAMFQIPARATGQLIELGQRHAATPFMTFLTVFGVLLSRYTGQVDVPVGVPVSGRMCPQVEGMVGFFINALVLRCDLSGAPDFPTALGRVRDLALGAFAHQSLPFERLVDAMAPERDLGGNPLYQVRFDLHDEGQTGTAVEGIGAEAFHRAWQIAKDDLCLYLQRRADGSMLGSVEYPTALFDPESMTRFASHFVALVESIGNDPTQPLATVDFLSPAERERLVADCQGDGPEAGCLLDRNGNLVPIGVPGELYRREEGAAGESERNPRAAGGSERGLRASGVLARRRSDGRIEILGSVRDPIRIRGCHVDPQRVERVVASHPGVAEAGVVADRDDRGAPRLLAAWTPSGTRDEATIAVDLAAYCSQRLAPHQVPAEFVQVEQIPRDASSRVDRLATLAAVALARQRSQSGGDAGARPPDSPTQQLVVEIWEELLGVEVPVTASFFGLGGNSILAIRMIARLREEFEVDVPIRAFFERPTVAGLAELIEDRIRAEVAAMSEADLLKHLALASDERSHPDEENPR